MGTNSKPTAKLPFVWVFLLAPFGIVGTSFVFFVLGFIARGDPTNLQFLIQGVSDKLKPGKKYGEIPWQLGLLTQISQ